MNARVTLAVNGRVASISMGQDSIQSRYQNVCVFNCLRKCIKYHFLDLLKKHKGTRKKELKKKCGLVK